MIAVGILAQYSSGYTKPELSDLYLKQFLWFGLGLVIVLFIFSMHLKAIHAYSVWFYFIIAFMLILTLVFGKTVRGTRGWLVFGPLNFQFSEIAKISTILVLARYLEYHFKELTQLRDFFIPFIIVLFPVLLILLQPDLGSTLAFFPVIIIMLFLAGADLKNIIYLIVIGTISIGVPLTLSYYEFKGILSENFWLKTLLSSSVLTYIIVLMLFAWSVLKIILIFYPAYTLLNKINAVIIILVISLAFSFTITHSLKPYQKKRLLVFIDPSIDPYGTGYNIVQSKISIGSGGFAGKGFLQGSQTQLGFLPEQTTDFIVSVVGEEFGWIGIITVLGLYLAFIVQGLKITFTARDSFSALVAGGITGMFAFAIFINIGMTLGIMPVTGVPVPFLSYGGSSLISSMVGAALLINIKSHRFV